MPINMVKLLLKMMKREEKKSGKMESKKSFSELPTFGIWKDKPQDPLEGLEELGKIEAMQGIRLLCEGDVTYQCLDLREGG